MKKLTTRNAELGLRRSKAFTVKNRNNNASGCYAPNKGSNNGTVIRISVICYTARLHADEFE